MGRLKVSLTLMVLFFLISCREDYFKEDRIFAGGIYASANSLNDGKSTYTEYCMPCHGVNGDGKGPSAKGLQVPPRNLKLGQYKFGRIVSGELPRDEDFYKIIREGLTGTAMLPWKELSDQQLFNLIQYIKTFAPTKWIGAEKKVGNAIVASKDPFGDAHEQSAINKGKVVYHVVAQCWTCHRAYVNHSEFAQMFESVNGKAITKFDSDMYHVKLQPNEYGYSSLPPDFTYDPLRSVKTVDELYVRISSGIGGTAMPSWKGTLNDQDIWAVSHYIKYLTTLKNSPLRKDLFEIIKKEGGP